MSVIDNLVAADVHMHAERNRNEPQESGATEVLSAALSPVAAVPAPPLTASI